MGFGRERGGVSSEHIVTTLLEWGEQGGANTCKTGPQNCRDPSRTARTPTFSGEGHKMSDPSCELPASLEEAPHFAWL